MVVDSEELRSAMRKWTTGVTVVATEVNQIKHGMTVNSFTSISLVPPLILVSLQQSTRTHKLVQEAGYFGLTILSKNQQKISDCFAGRKPDHKDRFEGLETRVLVTGAPFIFGGLAFLDCRVVSTYEAGNHTLFIADVLAILLEPETGGQGQPLVYYDRAYRLLQK
jgi:flavin reductase (DIM6/NTAB) family NADH-FMN oxidoreductase RutF